ncbi:XRE family transcriptional regulator [Bacillus sp. AFS094611]|uniref:XRE family transcriptional regulator n=2 Tax=Bacillus cereus group TaxID=86661 RepID=A0A2A7D1H0_BACAN|nr:MULTISPECIES: helix-turn-helix transcriptional regulator [Bacillus]MCP1163109.1 helix-turn-helix domain-containing protein [Bacillus sp. 1813sda1]MDC7972376.1 helix-turn-helix transcriptional regulator [Bacillus sp. BLCC-B18]OTW65169.1 transcriptional regulator [Bacillus thuringiensis serovar coreanensis]OTX42789.1 transcriptional regulator [Bacillus thuringiensis serovar sooncheon]OTX56425.1 transcriptional regulator [Bacillus thuringiensis serovar guiyangiensis]
MSLGQQLKRLRESQGFSQEDVAKKIGIMRQAVYKWENDKSCPDIENLILLSEMYNVTLDELIKGNQNLKEKIHIDEDEDFEKENEFSFYIGFGLLIASAFVNYEGMQEILLGIVLFMMFFYSDVKKVILNEFRSLFKRKDIYDKK